MGRGANETPTAALVEPSARAKPRRGQRQVVGHEAAALQRDLRLFDQLLDMAAEEDDEQKAQGLEDLAWAQMEEANPIRVIHAAQLLRVSDNTIRSWAELGLLVPVEGAPMRVGLSSVLKVKELVDELRELGQDRDLLSAVLNRLDMEALQGNDRFRESLQQMRRGERGSWPKHWASRVEG